MGIKQFHFVCTFIIWCLFSFLSECSASHPTGDHTIASHPTGDHTIASHPTGDQTIASQCSSHQTSRDSQNHSTESSHCLQENSDTDPILEFRDTSNSIQDGQTDTCYKTQIAKVIGHAPDVANFDKLRYELKSKQLTSHEECTKHDKLLANLQKAILNKRSSLMKNITHIEQCYFQQHANLPTEELAGPEYGTLLQKYKLSNKLLKAWNISL